MTSPRILFVVDAGPGVGGGHVMRSLTLAKALEGQGARYAFVGPPAMAEMLATFAPDATREFVWITPGSVAAAALWLMVSLAFKWYVFHFGNYQKTYGAIGGVMVALLWFYFSGLAILLGAQLNATIDRASSQPI